MAKTGSSSSKSNTSGTKRSYKKRTPSRQASKAASKAAKTRAENLARAEAREKRTVIILLILLFCLSALMFVSCFVDALSWMKDFCYLLFGLLMYFMPFLFITAGFLFAFHESETGPRIRRCCAVILLLFAVSGLIATTSVKIEDGGLLGKLNHLLIFDNMGAVGSWIVNIALVLIGLVLLVDFSVFDSIARAVSNQSARREIIRDSVEQERITREREKEEAREERLRERLSEKQKSKEEARRKTNNKRRFEPVYGIGDTTIRDNSDVKADSPLFSKDKQGEKLKNPKEISKENAALFSSYSNSGTVAAEKADDSDDFIPEIHVSSSYFSTDGQVDRSEDVFREPKLEAGDSYMKTVVTANGKITRFETDGDILSQKTIYHAGGNGAGNADSLNKSVSGKPENASSGAAKPENENVDNSENAPEEEPTKEYKFPPMNKLSQPNGASGSKNSMQQEIRETARKLQETLKTFGVGVTVTHVTYGPAVTRYELQPDMGVKVRKILEYTDDIKLNLAATDIRVEAPIPGKSAIGIEVPNKVKQTVVVREIMETDTFKGAGSKLSFALGKDIEGNAVVSDIAKMPHLLVAGTTGSGKSVCINSMIMSILYHATPEEVKLVMIDPKMVELSVYKGIPHLMIPVVTDSKKAGGVLNAMVNEMENRYSLFSELGVRNIEGYNELIELDAPEGKDGKPLKKMPLALIVVDELADLMMVAKNDVETAICRIAQKGRACGMHLVIATQRPSVNVITGLIKANIPSRIAFAVSSGFDSRTILDMDGAENLLGRGDMLYYPQGATKPVRIQGCFVSDEEIHNVVSFILAEGPVKGGTTDQTLMKATTAAGGSAGGASGDVDEFFAESGRLIIEKQKASIGMLQRAFKLGFNRAARIMDSLCEAGVVGEEEGTKPRAVLMTMDQFEHYLEGME